MLELKREMFPFQRFQHWGSPGAPPKGNYIALPELPSDNTFRETFSISALLWKPASGTRAS